MAPAAATPHAKKRKAAPTPQKDDADSKSAEKVSAKKPKVDKPATKAVADKPVVPVTKAPVVEEAFPRGGASALTPLEYREVSDQAKQDVLFEQQNETPEAKPKPKSKKRRAEDGKAEEDSAKKARTEGTTHAEMLSFKRLNVGMTLLGCIKEINDLDIAISLPDQLTGYVSITEISDYITAQVEKAAGDNEDSEEDEEEESEESVPELREYFGLGQVVSCVITALEHDADSEGKAGSGRRRVALSLKPELVNANISSSDLVEGLVLACSIVSEEDHGFILSVGIEGASGFLLKKNAKAFVEKQNEGRPLKIGQVLHGNVLKVDEARKVVSVTLDPEVQAKAVVPATQVIAFDALKAGALVNAKVKDVLDNGILLTFLGVLEGTVNLAHLGSLIVDPEEELPAKYKVGQRLRVRVLYVDPIRKKIAATLSPSLLHFVRFTPPAVEIGSIFDDFVVRRIDAKLGLLVEQKDAGFAFVHISRLSDTKVEKMDKNYKVGSKHRGRVTGIDYCDGLLHVSFQKSVLEQPFLRYDEIKPGMAVKGQVAKLLPNGAIISLAGSITGFCPKLHFADIALTQPEKMFKTGVVLKFLVLSVDAKNRKVTLTHKKSILNSTLPKVASYEDVKSGDIVHGVIMALKDFGCLVSFFGDVRALAPISELSEKFVEKAADVVTLGQVVKCRVLNVDAAAEKMRVSFKLLGGAEGQASLEAEKVGEIASATVISVMPSGLLVELRPSLARGYLAKSHLSDHTGNVEKLHKGFQERSVLKEVVIIGKDEKRGHAIISMKSLLIEETKRRKAAFAFDDIEEGMLVPGFVKNITDKRCFVSLVGGVVVAAISHNISDRYVTKVEDFLQIGQTVVAVVTKVDKEDHKIEISLKHSQCSKAENALRYETELLRSFFHEQDVLQFGQLPKDKVKAVKAWAIGLKLGEVTQAVVTSSMPYGVIVELPHNVSGLILNPPAGQEFAAGAKVNVKIMDANADRKIVDLIYVSDADVADNKPNADIAVTKEAQSKSDKKIVVEATIQIVKEDYAIAIIPSLHNAAAFVFSRHFNTTGTFARFRAGQQIKATITQVPSRGDSTKNFDGYIRQRLLIVPVVESEQPQGGSDSKRAIKGAIDPGFKSLDDYSLGATVKAKIASVKDTQLNMTLGSNLKGRVHITQVYDCIEDITDLKHPLHHFKIGDIIECKVIGFHDAKTHRTLPFSHRKNPSHTVVELTVKPSELALPEGRVSTETEVPPTLDTLQSGAKYVGFTQSVDEDALWIHIGPNLLGRAHLMDHPNPVALKRPHKFFPTGSAVQCWVVRANSERKILDLSLKVPGHHDTVEVGAKFNGKVKKVEAGKGLLVQISPALTGRVYLTDITDEYVKDPLEGFRVGGIVECVVIGSDTVNKRLDLSLRHSRTKPTEDAEVPNPEVKDIGDVVNDTVVSGYIRSISDGGVFVGLNHNLAARVKISELSDAFIKNWKEAYTVGQLVRGRIVNVNADQNRIEMSLKQSVVDPEAAGVQIKWNDIEQGQKVKGTVKAILEFGIFIQLANSAITGLCHKTELSDSPVTAIDKLYSVGDAVKALVLKVDREAKKLSLSLKASHFDETDYADDAKVMEMDESGSDAESDVAEVVGSDYEDEDENEDVEGSDAEEEDDAMLIDGASEGDDDDDDSMEIDEPTAALLNSFVNLPDESDDEDDEQEEQEGLDVGGFNWDGTSAGANAAGESDDEDGAEGSDDEDESTQTGKKKTRRAKQRAKREEEERIAQKEQSLLEGDQPPEVAEDFERLLLGSPNSSFLWIKFMAFQLQMAEVEKARQVAERALKSISFREEQEKMNVWVALMNLENSYGTQESLLKVFERAVSMNEPKAVYIQLIKIYERTEKWDQAEQLHQVATKKFNKSSKIWTSFGLFQLKRGKVEEARKILQRSLQSLAKRKHVKTICKFAQMEFKYGEPERGRTIFEGIMSNYPKRVDLWSVYLDMEIRNGDVSITRRLFERVIALKFSSKKMKFFFKKYLDFEKKNGTPETVNHVKQAAVAYVESLQN